MEEPGKLEEFSLLGGVLHQLGRRLGLVRGENNTVLLGLALSLGPWLILLVLAILEGITQQMFSLSVIGGHTRLLLAIPLFFLCETLLNPIGATFVRNIVRSGVVPVHALPALKSEIVRIRSWKDSWPPDALCLLAAVLFYLLAPQLHLTGTTTGYEPGRVAPEVTITGQWYLMVCLTLFRFLIFRWLWRLGLWCHFLWRLSRLDLNLVPTHPDGTAGLGYLEVVHTYFTTLVLAISAIQAASLAEEISIGAASIEIIYPTFALTLAIDAALFLGPLLILAPKLWACRVKGLNDYMEFASLYVSNFDRKWLGADAPSRDLLGTPDLQSLADLGNSIETVRNMRWMPVSLRLLKDFALAAVLPFLPLLLLEYPVTELAEKFFTRLSGL
jgi:hypothetical protein